MDALKQITFNRPFGARLILFVLLAVGGMFVATILIMLLGMTQSDAAAAATKLLRVGAVIQDIFLFLLPPVLCAILVTRLPARLLGIEASLPMRPLLLAVCVMICSLPMMEELIKWNESITFPSALAGIEQWMRQSEDTAAASVKLMMGGKTVADLILSVLIVGVLAGLSEEIFFRGGLQRLLATKPMNPHAAIWITAFIFSAIHLQFYGFVPRLLLGAFFGYLLWRTGSLWLPILCHILNNSIVAITTWQNPDEDASINLTDSLPDNLRWPLVICSVIGTTALLWILLRAPRGPMNATDR